MKPIETVNLMWEQLAEGLRLPGSPWGGATHWDGGSP